MLKADFRKTCKVEIAHGLDLEQVYKDQSPDFFIQNGVVFIRQHNMRFSIVMEHLN